VNEFLGHREGQARLRQVKAGQKYRPFEVLDVGTGEVMLIERPEEKKEAALDPFSLSGFTFKAYTTQEERSIKSKAEAVQ
jgi:hypothetical protein